MTPTELARLVARYFKPCNPELCPPGKSVGVCPSCDDHARAMRMAKAISKRIRDDHKAEWSLS